MRSGWKKRSCILAVSAVCLMWGCGREEPASELEEITISDAEDAEGEISEEAEGTGEDVSENTGTIFVHVCGYVHMPGVYELPEGGRLYEAVEAAGGMTGEAAGEYLNQAEVLSDGQQIYVPSAEEAEGLQVSQAGAQDDGKVNLNTAAKEELMTLSGIGEVKAESILKYREENGGFTSVEQLKEVEGIKEGVYNKVKDQITV